MNKAAISKIMRIVCGVLVALWNCGQLAKGDFVFGEPTPVPNINMESSWAASPHITRDGLELYFVSNHADETGDTSDNIWVSRRVTTKSSWSVPVKLPAPVNTTGPESFPCVSYDGLELYFCNGLNDIWMTTRASKDDPWGEPTLVPAPIHNSATADYSPCLSADGLEMYFASDRPGGASNPTNTDIFVATRATRGDPWGNPVRLGPNVNGSEYENTPFISADGLALSFSRGYSKEHVFVCRRPIKDAPWGPAEFLTPVNSGSASDVWGSSAGKAEYSLCYCEADSTVYFQGSTSGWSTDHRIRQIKVMPNVDTDNDGLVTTTEVLAMMDHFGSMGNAVYDVAPMPFGDRVVDARDLEVFLEYWGTDLRLAAHWPLDEASGTTARDAVSGQWAEVSGQAEWQRTGGVIDGALVLDGIDDSVCTPFVLDPAEGPFSVHLWIKGGAPGQVLVSQSDGVDWLWLAAPAGTLASSLVAPTGGRGSPTSLISDAVVTDGAWHQIAFVRDSTRRALYVDGVLVAEGLGESLVSASGQMNIGCGAEPDVSSTFFAGLIDDVRIYRCAVRP